MAINEEKKQLAEKALKDATKLYDDGKQRYDVVEAYYNKAKAAYNSAVSFGEILSNTRLDPEQALRMAASYAPNPQTYINEVNNNGNSSEALEAEKKKAKKELDLAKKELNKAQDEVNKTLKYLEGIKKRIKDINQQLGVIVGGSSLKNKANEDKVKKQQWIKLGKQKITWNEVKAKLRSNKKSIVTVAKQSFIFALTYLINNYLKKLSEEAARLGELVDRVNVQIESITTKQDVINAKVTRDAALVTINRAEAQMVSIRRTLKTLGIILLILRLVLFILLLIPLKVRPRKVRNITRTMVTIDAISIYVTVALSTLDSIIDQIRYHRSRLLPISDIIDKAIADDLDPEEIRNLINQSGELQLGPVPGVVYRGFTFAILEENNPKFVVEGNKRRYAVAYDRSGFLRLQSQPSFTLNPTVLIEELKILIDKQNIEA